MQVQVVVDEYRYAILQLSDTTQTWYMTRLKRFSKWCSEQGIQLGEIKPTTIAKYLDQMAKTPSETTGKLLSTHTIHGYARAIRTFLFWCASPPQLYMPRSIAENIVMPRVKRSVIETFTPLQIRALFAAAESEYTPPMQIRAKAILSVLLDTGIRASELLDLEIENVHIAPREGWLRVTGKGDKEREVGLGTKSRAYLHAWLKRYRKVPNGNGEQHVFLSHKRTPLTINGLDQLLYRLRDRAKITGVRVSAHTFRHTYAMNFLLQGGDVYTLSRLMGHSSVQVTEIYLRAIKSDQARKQSKSVLDQLL
jgi:integrase/recombinase XerD